ncbi:M67 family metallopeptidase [Sphingomonas sp. KR1UV-12]|uniref:M67 family metallopeptidase n=1 Tax=Sphingomonas aurea TaxID=3063994 RepID=A0ABT9EGP1_9SPHN|nr:M67 family metallopeptidase [Sphingomonas sp. KR1UV-12]MDP1026017.1 M67 family metallopeptidase [Sphingomonas sp. KR1UV-12]
MSSGLVARILAAAAADPMREVCGLLTGAPDRVSGIQPCANVAADPATRFEIDPAALLTAHRRARLGGPAIIGCYHSHPTGRAEPSPRDAADAAPDGSLWLIVADGRIGAWRAVSGGARHGRFDPVTLRCDAGEASTGLKNEENR